MGKEKTKDYIVNHKGDVAIKIDNGHAVTQNGKLVVNNGDDTWVDTDGDVYIE